MKVKDYAEFETVMVKSDYSFYLAFNPEKVDKTFKNYFKDVLNAEVDTVKEKASGFVVLTIKGEDL